MPKAIGSPPPQPGPIMTWFTVLLALFVLLALTALVSWLVLYIQFCHSVEKRWRNEVLGLLAEAKRQIDVENQQLRRLRSEQESEAHSLSESAYHSYLNGIGVEELEAYPGIGPATVGKLRAEGYVNLTRLRGARIHIHGLGEKRLADIGHAVDDLLRKAQKNFEAGECRPARTLREQLAHLPAKYDRSEVRARVRACAVEKVIERLREPVELARQVTFWRWFRPISTVALVPGDWLDAALPDLASALRSAEEQAAQTGTRRHRPPVRESDPPTARPADPPCPAPGPPAQARGDAPSVRPSGESVMPDETHVLLMELTIQFILGVARADGPVTWTERELIRQHIRQRFGYNRALLNRAEAFSADYETAAIDWESCLAQINERFTAAHRVALLEFAGRIIEVSGERGTAASPFLQRLARRLGVQPPAPPLAQPVVAPKPSTSPTNSKPVPQMPSPAAPLPPPQVVAAPAPPARPRAPAPMAAATPKPSPRPTRDECLALLEISANTSLSADLVRRQWNLLCERLAPEKVASMGVEVIKLVESKRAALRRAAERLLEQMGEHLEIKPPPRPERPAVQS